MKMNENMTQRNIELSAEFSRYLFEHPETEHTLPQDAEIVLLPDFDPELLSYNRAIGSEMEARGERVTYIHVGKMRPKTISRIESVAIGT